MGLFALDPCYSIKVLNYVADKVFNAGLRERAAQDLLYPAWPTCPLDPLLRLEGQNSKMRDMIPVGVSAATAVLLLQ